jgi:hypothetical protein
MARLQQSGIEIDLPPGWEGRIFSRTSTHAPGSAPAGRSVEPVHPVLHAANFAVPTDAGDFGGGAVEQMGNGHVFVSLIDYGPESAGTPLFGSRTLPQVLRTDQFDPMTLQRTLVGQSGTQQFFTAAGRGFCLYVVLGAHLFRVRLVPLVNEALRTLRIS